METIKKLRQLDEICVSNNFCFLSKILGIDYCMLALSGKKIDCIYIGEKDHNDLNTCDYNKIIEILKNGVAR